jgi:hypothetical protein
MYNIGLTLTVTSCVSIRTTTSTGATALPEAGIFVDRLHDALVVRIAAVIGLVDSSHDSLTLKTRSKSDRATRTSFDQPSA